MAKKATSGGGAKAASKTDDAATTAKTTATAAASTPTPEPIRGNIDVGLGYLIVWHVGERGGPSSGTFLPVVLMAAFDRLDHYQSTPFKCDENAAAMTALKDAVDMLAYIFKIEENQCLPMSAHFLAMGKPAGGVSSGFGLTIVWQNGPLVDESGKRIEPNGAFVETIIGVVVDRINATMEDHAAKPILNQITVALDALKSRTKQREKRGVEGTHEV